MESLFTDGDYVESQSAIAIEVENPAMEELGAEGISAFTQPKHVHMDFAQAPSPEWWFPYERPAIDEREIAGAGASSV